MLQNAIKQRLFDHPSHSPSFAQLTDNFAHAKQVRDYCIPINFYFPDPELMRVFLESLPYAIKYYPTDSHHIAEYVCRFIEHDNQDQLVLGNGSTELITWLNHLYITDSLAIPVPSFGRWTEEPQVLGRKLHPFFLQEKDNFCMNVDDFVQHVRESQARAAVICNPNNPTGTLLSVQEVEHAAKALQHLDLIVIDESFIDFSCENPPTVSHLPSQYPNLVVVKSMGKNLGLHGIRAGYMIAPESIAKNMRKVLPHWNVNGIVESLLRIIAPHKKTYKNSLKKVIADREYMIKKFEQVPIWKMFPSGANFIYFRLNSDFPGHVLRDQLFGEHGCLVRSCGNKMGSNSEFFRIAVRSKEEIDYLCQALQTCFLNKSYPDEKRSA